MDGPPPRRGPAFYRAVLERVAPREGWAREEARTVRAPAARARDTAPPPDPAAYTALVAWERAACGAPGWADEDERARAEGELIARLAR